MTDRRTFLKTCASGCASVLMYPLSSFTNIKGYEDIGEVKGLTIKCISETGWFDSSALLSDVKKAGGIKVNQYDIEYAKDNGGGFSALITIESLDGKKTNYLLDSGWNTKWMDHAFEKAGVDELLQNREVDAFILSHDHNDHFWGIESTLKNCQNLTLYHPDSIHSKSHKLLNGADFSNKAGNPCNKYPHIGKRVPVKSDKLEILQSGVALKKFDVDVPLGVSGENVIYVKVKDKGYVVITGCGHPGIGNIVKFVKKNLKDGKSLYGCYGGLHIAPMEKWFPRMYKSIEVLKQSGMTKIACNHCTGRVWVKKAIKAGLPIVKGSYNFKSYKRIAKGSGSNIYIGNGDSVKF